MANNNADKKQEKYPDTLCWRCKKATGGCAWADCFYPVKGWRAKELSLRIKKGKTLKTFVVYTCPEYISDGRRTVEEIIQEIVNITGKTERYISRLLYENRSKIYTLLSDKGAPKLYDELIKEHFC